MACAPQCRDAKSCEVRESCPYARTFEPSAQSLPAQTLKPSGFADWPRPFVFRARHLDGHTIYPGGSFYFDLHVFALDRDVLAYFILTFAALTREGLGPRRSRAELQRVSFPGQIVYEASTQVIADSLEPVKLDLTAPASAPTNIRIGFLSPTELKHDHKIASRPEFPILFGRIRDRIATLSRLYGAGPLDIDYLGSNDRASRVRLTSCRLCHDNAERRSTRTGQSHPMGGFIGTAEYEGDLAEFFPFLQAAKWTGVGRHSVWGMGEIEIDVVLRS